jgi:hypothetical protein
MKLDYLAEKKKKTIPIVLVWFSVALGILIFIKLSSFFIAPAKAENSVKRAIELTKPDANSVERYLAKSKAIVDELKKNNLFVPRPPKKHPVSSVLGILGSEVLINGKWYKAGDKVGDAKIVAIEPTQVRIEWEGNEKVFSPLQTSGESASDRPGRGGPRGREAGGSGRAEMVVVGGNRRGGPGRGEDFRAEMRARFENMSEEERQAFRDRMRERFGGRGPGGGGGPGGRGDSGGRRGGRGGRD